MSNYSDGVLELKERNTSWTKIFEYVFEGSKVLDFGCSSGYLGEQLKKLKNCKVQGVELDLEDAKKAEKVLDKVYRFNIETEQIPKELQSQKFDAIILADVIEHFVNPMETLKKLQTLLHKDGRIIFSIPNMAHISVRLQLLQGDFNYNETGLLDKTHLHFYNFNEVERVFSSAGLQIEHNDANTLPYPPKLLTKKLEALGLKDNGFIENIQHDVNAQSFQFVGFAKPAVNQASLKKIQLSTTTPEKELISYIKNLEIQEGVLRAETRELSAQLDNATAKLDRITGSTAWRLFRKLAKPLISRKQKS